MKELMKQESRPAPTKVKVKKKEAGQRRAISGTLPDLSPEFLASRTILLVVSLSRSWLTRSARVGLLEATVRIARHSAGSERTPQGRRMA
jgi:hypothetical protein